MINAQLTNIMKCNEFPNHCLDKKQKLRMCTKLKDARVIVSGHGNLAHPALLTLLNVRHIQVGLGLGYAIDFFAGQLLLAVVIETYARPQA